MQSGNKVMDTENDVQVKKMYKAAKLRSVGRNDSLRP